MNNNTTIEQSKYLILKGVLPDLNIEGIIPCYTLAKLLEMLPMGASISKGGENLVGIESNDWFVDYAYEDENGNLKYKVFHSEDLIQAIIDMLVELKTNK